MTNEQYIAAMKKALEGLDRTSRDDIIKEIQSHEAESGTSLLERFGSPESLAEQYLEGEVLKTPVIKQVGGIGKSVFNFGKKMLLWVCVLISTLIFAIIYFIWNVSSDDFNYADESAVELHVNSADWISTDWVSGMTVDIDQSSVVIYWHDEPTVRWQCNGAKHPSTNIKKDELRIRQSKCLIMIPKESVKLISDQAQVVLVRPQSAVDIKIKQTGLRIAENKTKYRYIVNSAKTSFEGLESHDDAEITIKIESEQAQISAYEEE